MEVLEMIEILKNNILTEQTKVLFIIVIIILGLEILSGVLKGIKNKNLDSTKFREGLLSKSGYFLQIVLCLLVSMFVNLPYLLYMDLIWISCSEGVSVLENLNEVGVPCPSFVKDVLEKTKKTTEDTMESKINNEDTKGEE
jgi:toxin secretion/phage lysis holin